MRGSYEIAKYIEEILKERNIKPAEYARMVGVDRSTISRYFNGSRKIPMEEIPALAKALNLSPFDLLVPDDYSDSMRGYVSYGYGTYDYPYFPTGVSAGLPIGIEPITSSETIPVPDEFLGKFARNENIYFTRVNGDSMNKVFPHGSLIAIKQIEISELKNGDIVVYSNCYDYAVKRFYDIGNKLIFKPESTDPCFMDDSYDKDNSENLKLHGKVVTYIVNVE